MKYCNYRDDTSVYSLNSWKFPGRFSYGLGTRLGVTMTNLEPERATFQFQIGCFGWSGLQLVPTKNQEACRDDLHAEVFSSSKLPQTWQHWTWQHISREHGSTECGSTSSQRKETEQLQSQALQQSVLRWYGLANTLHLTWRNRIPRGSFCDLIGTHTLKICAAIVDRNYAEVQPGSFCMGFGSNVTGEAHNTEGTRGLTTLVDFLKAKLVTSERLVRGLLTGMKDS